MREGCGTFYPQQYLSITHVQECARCRARQDEIRLLNETRDVATRVVGRHRSVGMAKQCLPVLSADARSTQLTGEGVAQIVDACLTQSRPLARTLPGAVVHPRNTLAAKGEDPHGMLAALCLHDRPGGILQDHDVGAPGLEGLYRYHEDTSVHFGHGHFSLPLQSADVAVAQPRVHRKERHAPEMRRQQWKEAVLFLPGEREGQARRGRQQGMQGGSPASQGRPSLSR